MLAARVLYEGIVNEEAAKTCFKLALEAAGTGPDEIDYVVTTGYGRNLVKFGDKSITEISCHAAGLHELLPLVRTVIDVGGQDSKVMALDEGGMVLNFRMNDRCAAGTGRFLEVMARAMSVELGDLGALALRSSAPAKVSSTCAVFAESEMISLSAEGEEKEDIVAGMHEAICRRLAAMVSSVGMVRPLAMTGGVAKNPAMLAVLGRMLGAEILTPPEPQIVGALGAARFALSAARSGAPRADPQARDGFVATLSIPDRALERIQRYSAERRRLPGPRKHCATPRDCSPRARPQLRDRPAGGGASRSSDWCLRVEARGSGASGIPGAHVSCLRGVAERSNARS